MKFGVCIIENENVHTTHVGCSPEIVMSSLSAYVSLLTVTNANFFMTTPVDGDDNERMSNF